MIPRIIHQTWKDNNLPPDFRKSYESWKAMHPDWEYILWTDKMNRELIATEFPWFLKYYDNYEYNIQRVDAIRYFILWKYGGVYADMDIVSQKPLDPILELMEKDGYDLANAKSGHLNYYSNWFMISSQGNEFWPILWDALVKAFNYKSCWQCWTKHLKVMYSTGPAIVNRVIQANNTKCLALEDGFNSCSVCDPQPCECKDCYIINLNAGSWNSWDSKLLNKLLCNWQYMVLLILMVAVMLIIIHPCASDICIKGQC